MADNIFSGSVLKIFRGALLIGAGFLGGGVLTLGLKVMIARFFQPEIYGIFSQGMAVLYTLVMITLLGLNAGISRQISFSSDEDAASKAVGSSLAVVLPLSIVAFGALHIYAGAAAETLFSDSRMTEVLRVLAVAGPAMAVNSILISGFRGLQSSKERVIILDFLIPFLQILFTGAAIVAGLQIGGVALGYASAFVLSTLMTGWLYRKTAGLQISLQTLESLVKLSWPLMISAVSVQIFLWSPTVITGALATSRDSGLLNSALPLAASAKMFLSSAAFLYLPVVSELFGKDSSDKVSLIHSSVTKWIVYLSAPVLLFFVFYPSRSVQLMFGSGYTEAGVALLVMALGYIFNNFTGPLGELLIAKGETSREMASNLLKLAVFSSIAVFSASSYGFLGVAAAYSAGMIAGDLARLWFSRNIVGNIYSVEFLRPLAGTGLAFAGSLMFPGTIPKIFVWCVIYGGFFLLSRPLTSQDRQVLDHASIDILEKDPVRKVVNRLSRQS